MPVSTRTKKVKEKPVNTPVQPEQKMPKASRTKASKVNIGVPPKVVEEESTLPTPAPTVPKKRGRKPKQVIADNLPPEKEAFSNGLKATDKPAVGTHGGKTATPKTPVPIRDPLPSRGGRNTHPGLMDGVQPAPRRSSQEVAAERKCKRLELEAKLRAAEEAKNILAQMELEDERIMQGIEEECRQPLDYHTGILVSDEEFRIDDIETDEDDDDDEEEEEEEEPKRKKKKKEACKKGEVSPHLSTEDF